MELALPKRAQKSEWRVLYSHFRSLGAALLYGDGMITKPFRPEPVEGLEVATPVFSHYVVRSR